MSKVKTASLAMAVLIMVMMLALTPGMAVADMTPLGDVFMGNSWSQRFEENGVFNGVQNTLSKIEAFIMSSGTFEDPGMRNFGSYVPSGVVWSGDTVNPKYTVATGTPTTTYLQWDFTFNDPRAPLTMDYFAYSGTTLLGSARLIYSGTGGADGWSFGNA